MRDQFGRNIDYMRISITDRCNLRCSYCMPQGTVLERHEDVLRYEEFLQIAGAAIPLGITRFKVTGGEPLVRRGCLDFLRKLKALPGVEQVTLTTNGVLLESAVSPLAALGLDGVNISLDTADPKEYRRITGFDRYDEVRRGIEASVMAGIPTKLNCVLLAGCGSRLIPLAELAEKYPMDVRFIEVMPIGQGTESLGLPSKTALEILKIRWPDLHLVDEIHGNGPARYYAGSGLMGRIGMIDAVSHKFCERCNRVRITSKGLLKPCLCYSEGTDLRTLLRSGTMDRDTLSGVIKSAIWHKPRAHCFEDLTAITEQKSMSEIGG